MGFFNFSKKNDVRDGFTCNITLEELAERLKVLYGDQVFIDGDFILVSIADTKFMIMHQPRETSIYITVGWHIDPEDITSYQDLCIFCNESNRVFASKVFAEQYDDKIDLVIIREIPFFDKITVAGLNQVLLEVAENNADIIAEFNRRFPPKQHSAVDVDANIQDNQAESLQSEKIN